MQRFPIYLDLFKVIFYGFYHGKSSLNHHLGNILLFFPTTLSKSKYIEIRKVSEDSRKLKGNEFLLMFSTFSQTVYI